MPTSLSFPASFLVALLFATSWLSAQPTTSLSERALSQLGSLQMEGDIDARHQLEERSLEWVDQGVFSPGFELLKAHDGTLEDAFHFITPFPQEWAWQFEQPSGGQVEQIEVYLTSAANYPSAEVTLNIYRNDEDRPTDLLASFPVSGSLTASQSKVFTTDPIDVAVPATFWVAVEWDSTLFPDLFVAVDTTFKFVRESLKGRTNEPGNNDWGVPMVYTEGGMSGIGFDVTWAATATDCQEAEGTLCVLGDRFQFTLDWTDPNDSDSRKPLGLVRYSDTSVQGYFLNPSNLEVLAKVVDGCALNGHYWIFSGGVTNQNVRLTVTDTVDQTVKLYENSRGIDFLTVTDTEAFPCSNN